MIRTGTLSTLLLASSVAFTQIAPGIEWQSPLGGIVNERGNDIRPTIDGGYIVAGNCSGNFGMILNYHGGTDFCVVKLASNGSTQWARAVGGSGDEYANSIQQTNDQGYIVVGASDSDDGDVSGNHGGTDMWAVKLDPDGSIAWQASFGGSDDDYAEDILQTADGGYILVGGTASIDGDVTNNHGGTDAWCLRLNANGSIDWQRTYGGSSNESGMAVLMDPDGSIVMAGAAGSMDGDVTGFHGGANDFWLLHITGTVGDLLWQRTYGGSDSEYAFGLARSTSGGFILTGPTSSMDGDISVLVGGMDIWAVRVDPQGELIWQRTYGGSATDVGNAIVEAGNGDWVIAGLTHSVDGDVSLNHGAIDAWVLRIDDSGDLLWERSCGGAGNDVFSALSPTLDAGYILIGGTRSTNADVVGNHGEEDIWVVKLATDFTAVPEQDHEPFDIQLWPNPVTDRLCIQINNDLAGLHSIEVVDQVGRIVLSKRLFTAGTGVINLSVQPLSAGPYELRLLEDGVIGSRPFIKQ